MDFRELARDPLEQFERWYSRWAARAQRDPDAAALATCGAGGAPSVRMVLVRRFDPRGFCFFTNYQSRKASELDEYPLAALLFYWPAEGRQVRLEGTVERVDAAESDAYFATRHRLSQLSAAASLQSQPLADREVLEARVKELEDRFAGRPVPRPEHWGGYRLVPQRYEFWQEGPGRLHDRALYTQEGAGWRLERLYP